MNRNRFGPLRPLFFLFVILNALFIAGRNFLSKRGIDYELLIVGNVILFAVSYISFYLVSRSLKSDNPQAFVRAMYGSFMIKFFVVAIAAFIYIMIAKKNVNKPGLMVCAGLYIIYTGIEIRTLTKMLREKKNA
jgi:threonine/homoserine/homoserine lactone efflux protein